jgi:hypothetical protein
MKEIKIKLMIPTAEQIVSVLNESIDGLLQQSKYSV